MKLVLTELPSLITLPVNESLLGGLSLVVGYLNEMQIDSKVELEIWPKVPNFITLMH